MGLGAISSVGLPLARPAVGCSTVEVAAVTVVGVLKCPQFATVDVLGRNIGHEGAGTLVAAREARITDC